MGTQRNSICACAFVLASSVTLGKSLNLSFISPSIKMQVLGDSLVSFSYNFMIIPVPCDWSRYEGYSGWRKQQHKPPHISSPCLEGAYILSEDGDGEGWVCVCVSVLAISKNNKYAMSERVNVTQNNRARGWSRKASLERWPLVLPNWCDTVLARC